MSGGVTHVLLYNLTIRVIIACVTLTGLFIQRNVRFNGVCRNLDLQGIQYKPAIDFLGHISFCAIFFVMSQGFLRRPLTTRHHLPQTRNTQHDSADEERETQRRCLR